MRCWAPWAVRVMKTVFSPNLSCVFLYDHKRDCVQSKPDRRRGKESTGGSWPFLRWTGPDRKVGSAYLRSPWANEDHCSKAKRLGHFTVSSQEEQIASAPRDGSGDGPERGLCSPGGDAWMPWLGCRGWHVVFLETGWRCKLYFRLWFYFGPIFLTLTQSWKSGSNRFIQA